MHMEDAAWIILLYTYIYKCSKHPDLLWAVCYSVINTRVVYKLSGYF